MKTVLIGSRCGCWNRIPSSTEDVPAPEVLGRQTAPWRSTAAWIALMVLLTVGVGGAEGDPVDKRVEHRGTPGDSNPRPVGTKPGHSDGNSPDGSQDKCETQHLVEETTTTVVEEQVIHDRETVIVEVPWPAGAPSTEAIFEELLQNTIGRPKVLEAIACVDPRNPLPSYAFIGIVPQFSYRSREDTVRLQRFECEIEVDGSWRPLDSIFTLVVGASHFQISLDGTKPADTLMVRDSIGGRAYPVIASLVRRGPFQKSGRLVLSFAFVGAASRQAPDLRPGDAVYVSVDPAPTVPSSYVTPRLVLVNGTPEAPTSLLLIEKSGAASGLIPSVSALDLASYCSVVHFVPE